MIKIEIAEPNKLRNNVLVKYSALIKFDYSVEILNYIKNLSTRVYIPETHTWEIPFQNIPDLCNKFEDENIHINGTYHVLKDTSNVTIPDSYRFKTKPFAHQVDGIKFALSHDKFLLCDEQGLGKTKTIIDYVGCLDCDHKINKVLIICGVNSLKYNWQNEIETHSNERGWILGTRYRKNGNAYEGSAKDKLYDLDNIPDCKYIITNIETLRAGAVKVSKYKYSFPVAEKIKKLCDEGIISVIAFDECHKAKNSTSLQGRAMSLVKASYMCAMSGTPLMNNPIDLYFPLHWLGYEEHSLYQFKQHYCRFGGYGSREITGYKNLGELRNTLDAIMIRRLKSEVLDLPKKIHKLEFVDMNPKQAVLYKEIQNNLRNEIYKVKIANNTLSMLIRLRQVTGCPNIITDLDVPSAKLDRMEELVEELHESGQKCIIFSNWSNITEAARCKLKKYHPAYITGETTPNERMNEVNKFQNDPNCSVIIGTIGAMGTGLTLTAAQTVIFLDSPWNRALKDQAEDRAHRIGTSGTVNIITICCKNTIDEWIEDIVYRKGAMSDAIVDGKTNKLNATIINELLK